MSWAGRAQGGLIRFYFFKNLFYYLILFLKFYYLIIFYFIILFYFHSPLVACPSLITPGTWTHFFSGTKL